MPRGSLFAHLALAQFHHLSDHLVHALIGSRVDDCGLADAEIALFCGSLDLVDVADEDDVHQVVLEQTVGRFEDAGVGAFGEDDGAACGLECVDQLRKHKYYLHAAVIPHCLGLLYNVRADKTTAFLKNQEIRPVLHTFPFFRETDLQNVENSIIIKNTLYAIMQRKRKDRYYL